MAIGDSSKLDLLWKKVGYGVTETSSGKNAIEESIASPYIILGNQVWQEGDKIPNPAAALTNIVESVSLQIIADPTVPSKNAWLAVRDFSTGITTANRLGDFIPFTVAPSYEVKLYSDAAKTQRLLPGTAGYEWVFDYAAGVVWFANALPSGVTTLYLTGYRYIGKKGVGSSGAAGTTLGTPTDGSYDDGFVQGWVPGTTTISDAIDQLNKTILDVYPRSPYTIPQTGLSVLEEYNSFNDILLVLASGFTDATNNSSLEFKTQPGQSVTRVFKNSVNSNAFGPFGSKSNGTITLKNNGVSVGSKTLTLSDDTGIYNHLVILNDEKFPSNYSSAYKQILIKAIDITPQQGLNYIQFVDENGSSNPAFFVYDTSTIVPSLGAVSVGATSSNLPFEYSSGIPHLSRGMNLNVGISAVKDLATELCLSNKQVVVETTPSVTPVIFTTQGNNGLPNTLAKAASYNVTLSLPIDDNDNQIAYATSDLKITLNNPNGSYVFSPGNKINVMRSGTFSMSPIDEMAVLVENLGNEISGQALTAQRVRMDAGDLPSIVSFHTWDSMSSTASLVSEASVVGGAIIASKENYSLATVVPTGPDYSGKNSTQWATFMIMRNAVSNMKIHIEGSHSGCYVALQGTTNLPYTINGWWDTGKLYSGVGTPGREQNDGCAVGMISTGRSQELEVSFGQENSSNHNGRIFVRFKLNAGDKITGLKFTGV